MSAPTHGRGVKRGGSNRYCGPFAIAHILGMTTDEVESLVRTYRGGRRGRGRYAVRGMANREVLAILFGRGRKIERDHALDWLDDRITLARWLKGKTGLWLVNVTGHYVVLDGRRIYDNAHPDGLPKQAWPHRRKRVKAAWRIS